MELLSKNTKQLNHYFFKKPVTDIVRNMPLYDTETEY